jgi:hypothetical protein
MCGIAGIINVHGAAVTFAEMLNPLNAFGKDVHLIRHAFH